MILSAKNIIHYYEKERVMNDISLDINRGEFISIVGESGSGKSTFLSILSTLLQPTQGEIEILGQDSSKIKNIDNFRRTNIGFIFQFHYLINHLNIYDNISLATDKENIKNIKPILELLDIDTLSSRYPNEISGGQRQRVAIARALANNPAIIFADEPTGNLDSKNSQIVFDKFRDIANKGTTIIVATHNMKLANQANRVITISDGKVI
ncbi:ABC transporter ATP-binding protein [hydrothermal vent metagenome]|uniref:ABC transporter ATP-binding protein n=1 Tax=hydrothermal vent metagenome TaxID=652676 RepID=A0A1W1EIL0_9ZZZZ